MLGAVELCNWGGNYRYRARVLHRPTSLAELQRLVVSRRRLRAIGSRHSFTAISDGDELVTLEDLPGEVTIDRDAQTVWLPSQLRYEELAGRLAAEGLALANLASLPHISVSRAVASCAESKRGILTSGSTRNPPSRQAPGHPARKLRQ
jgi:xylitol oxidase